MGTEKFKWFDFLGALILLVSVTKSALNLPRTTDPSGAATIPSSQSAQEVVSPQNASHETALIQADLLNPSLDVFFERPSSAADTWDRRMRLINDGGGAAGNQQVVRASSKTVHLAELESPNAITILPVLGLTHPRLFRPLSAR